MAAARATLPPSGLTGRMPGISCASIWMTADPLALSSMSLARHCGHFAETWRTAFAGLVEQDEIGSCPAPHLADNEIRSLQVFKSAIPGLDQFVDPDQLKRCDRLIGTIWQPNLHRRKIGSLRLPKAEPVAPEQTTSGRGRSLLKLA